MKDYIVHWYYKILDFEYKDLTLIIITILGAVLGTLGDSTFNDIASYIATGAFFILSARLLWLVIRILKRDWFK